MYPSVYLSPATAHIPLLPLFDLCSEMSASVMPRADLFLLLVRWLPARFEGRDYPAGINRQFGRPILSFPLAAVVLVGLVARCRKGLGWAGCA